MVTLINRLLVGSLNSLGSVTLTDNGTTTTLSDNHLTRGCKVFLFPTTAHAALVTGLWAGPTSVPAGFEALAPADKAGALLSLHAVDGGAYATAVTELEDCQALIRKQP